MNDELIEEMITKIASEYMDMPEEQVVADLKANGFDKEDIDDIMQTITEVKGAEAGTVENQAQQMANEDNTPTEVTETDKDSDGDVDKTVIEKKEPDDDEVKNPSEEHSEANDKPNDSDDSDSLNVTDEDIANAVASASAELKEKDSTPVGSWVNNLRSEPGRD